MKTSIKNLLLSVLITVLVSILAVRLSAQTLTTLYNFSSGSTGDQPIAGLALSGNRLYGTASSGGIGSYGTVFAVNTDGSGFTNLHSFTGGSNGYHPTGGLVVSSNMLYGTTYYGGSAGNGNGTIFAVGINGTGFTNLYSFTAFPPSFFTNSDGANPYAGLILSGNTLYGTAYNGGKFRHGTVFALNTDGTGFTNLHNFNQSGSDGSQPYGGLILSGSTLYGTTSAGGTGSGTVFALNTNGTGFTVVHPLGDNTIEGYYPERSLVLSGNRLYGTASLGGAGSAGIVFAVNTDGTGFTNLHSFNFSDGAYPFSELILSGNTLFGTASAGGSGNYGTVFALNTDGTGFTNLHSLTYAEGVNPYAGLILSSNTLYGTANSGGSGNFGTVYSLSFKPQLTISPSGAHVVLSWPVNYAGFDFSGYTLQSSSNLGVSAVWVTNSPQPVIVNGLATATNPISGAQQFYRLSR